ncbi:MAG: glutamine-hydrolyzing GMP synthase [bacterium]
MHTILVLDFGGQYCHLISRRIKDLGVYSYVAPSDISIADIEKIKDLKGIVLSGGAASVYDKKSPKLNKKILELGIPVLGICYGHQLIAHLNNGEVVSAKSGEYGLTDLKVFQTSVLLNGLKSVEKVWMNHKDIVKKLSENYLVVATTSNNNINLVDHPTPLRQLADPLSGGLRKSPLTPLCERGECFAKFDLQKSDIIAAFENNDKKIYGVQFHPEVSHTENGNKVFENFVFKVCKAKKGWDASNIIKNITDEIKEKLGSEKTIIGLSGGVDSSTAAILINQVIGKKLVCVYVDTGLMRHKETEFIQKAFAKFNLNLKIVRAQDRFFKNLKAVTDPETKRKIIGKLFIEIFDEVALAEKAKVLVQGTIYSDRIESGATKHSSNIKSHHNVGGLPKDMKLKIYEPLRDLYKDEVRLIAKKLGLPDELALRQVFPGPGLAIRIIGEVTPEKTEIVRAASYIIQTELEKAHLFDKVWMAFAVLLSIKSVGIQGDSRSYKYPVVVRIVESKDAMTANFAKIPYDVLEKISTRITNEIKEVNRVVYDISNKPPATMEWE